jgi:hypothetical protein
MRKQPKHRPDRPTTCDISDLLKEVSGFVNENPLWADDPESLAKMAIVYAILTNMSDPSMVTDEEYEFVIGISEKIKDSTNG